MAIAQIIELYDFDINIYSGISLLKPRSDLLHVNISKKDSVKSQPGTLDKPFHHFHIFVKNYAKHFLCDFGTNEPIYLNVDKNWVIRAVLEDLGRIENT